MTSSLLRCAVVSALISAVENSGVSSLHVTFATRAESDLLEQVGFLTRLGVQYHWSNTGYGSFDDFLAALNSRKRKAVRKERAAVAEYGLDIRAYEGAELTTRHWPRSRTSSTTSAPTSRRRKPRWTRCHHTGKRIRRSAPQRSRLVQ